MIISITSDDFTGVAQSSRESAKTEGKRRWSWSLYTKMVRMEDEWSANNWRVWPQEKWGEPQNMAKLWDLAHFLHAESPANAISLFKLKKYADESWRSTSWILNREALAKVQACSTHAVEFWPVPASSHTLSNTPISTLCTSTPAHPHLRISSRPMSTKHSFYVWPQVASKHTDDKKNGI